MLRRDKLCPGAENCTDAQQSDEPGLPCRDCRMVDLDTYLETPMGSRFKAALELDFALRAGFTISLDDISAIEFGLLRMLDEERHRYEKDQLEKARPKHGRQ